MRSDKLIFEEKLKCYENILKRTAAPLDMIRGLLENVLSKDIPLPVAREVRWIKMCVNRMMDRCNHIVGRNNVNGWKDNELKTSEYELYSYITSLVNQFRSYADKRHIQLKVCKGDGCIGCNIDGIFLTAALQILFKKVIDITPWNGCVNIEVSHRTDQWSIQITNCSDTGKGRHGILRQFYKLWILSHLDKHRYMQLLINLHGGRITGYEQGSSVHYVITIPIDTNPMSRESAAKQEDLTKAHASDMEHAELPHILLIMDDKEFSSYLETSLSSLFRITILDDCSRFAGSLSHYRADVVIIDESLSCVSGIGLCTQIKSDKSMFNIPVVLLMGNEIDGDYGSYWKSSADWVISRIIHARQLQTELLILIKERIRLGEQFKKMTHKKSTPVLSQITAFAEKDTGFVERLHQLLEEHLADEEYGVETLAADMNMGRTNFYYTMKRVLGKSPKEYIFYFKMEKAKQLLLTRQYNVTDISILLGYSTPKYFGKLFKKYCGFSPKEYVNKQGKPSRPC